MFGGPHQQLPIYELLHKWVSSSTQSNPLEYVKECYDLIDTNPANFITLVQMALDSPSADQHSIQRHHCCLLFLEAVVKNCKRPDPKKIDENSLVKSTQSYLSLISTFSQTFKLFMEAPYRFPNLSLAKQYLKVYLAYSNRVLTPYTTHLCTPSVNLLIQRLQGGTHLLESIFSLLGLFKFFEYELKSDHIKLFIQALKVILEILNKESTLEPIYYYGGLKYMSYMVQATQTKQVFSQLELKQWLPLTMRVISANLEANCPNVEELYEETNSPEYIYLHTKKRAYRSLNKFLGKIVSSIHLIKSQIKQDHKKIEKIIEEYEDQYEKVLVFKICEEISKDYFSKKIKAEQMRLLMIICRKNASQWSVEELQIFLENILIKQILIGEKQAHNIVHNPYDYVHQETDFMYGYNRCLAQDCFIEVALKIPENKRKIKNRNKNEQIKENQSQQKLKSSMVMELMQKMLSSQDSRLCEAGLFLIQSSFIKMCRCEPLLSQYYSIIVPIVCKFLRSPEILIRYSAFKAANSVIRFLDIEDKSQSLQIFKAIATASYDSLTKDESVAVRFNAALTFLQLSCYSEMKSLPFKQIREEFQSIIYESLIVILKLTEEFESEQIVQDLMKLVQNGSFNKSLAPLAPEILSKVFRTCYQMMRKQKEQYQGGSEVSFEDQQRGVQKLMALISCIEMAGTLIKMLPKNNLKLGSPTEAQIYAFVSKTIEFPLEMVEELGDMLLTLIANFIYCAPEISEKWWAIAAMICKPVEHHNVLFQNAVQVNKIVAINNYFAHIGKCPNKNKFLSNIIQFTTTLEKQEGCKGHFYIFLSLFIENTTQISNNEPAILSAQMNFIERNNPKQLSSNALGYLYFYCLAFCFDPFMRVLAGFSNTPSLLLERVHSILVKRPMGELVSRSQSSYYILGCSKFFLHFIYPEIQKIETISKQSFKLISSFVSFLVSFVTKVCKFETKRLEKEVKKIQNSGAGILQEGDWMSNGDDEYDGVSGGSSQNEEEMQEGDIHGSADYQMDEQYEDEGFFQIIDQSKNLVFHQMVRAVNDRKEYRDLCKSLKGEEKLQKAFSPDTLKRIQESLVVLEELEKLQKKVGLDSEVEQLLL